MSMLKSIVEEMLDSQGSVEEPVEEIIIEPGCEVLVGDDWFTVIDVDADDDLIWVESEEGEEGIAIDVDNVIDARC